MINKTLAQSIALLLLATSKSSYASQVSYDGYSLYRCEMQTSNHFHQLRSLMTDRKQDGVEFWKEPSESGTSVDIMASPEEQESLRDQFRMARLPCKVIMYDVGEVIRRTSVNSYPRILQTYRDGTNISLDRQANLLEPNQFYSHYQTYEMIEQKLKKLAQDPRVTLEVAGLSYENRQLYLVKISKNSKSNSKKPVIFLDAGHHAREWISHSTLLYLMESLVNDNMPAAKFKKDEDCNEIIDHRAKLRLSLKSLLEKYDFWFLPVVNPDGYEYTHRYDRLWRKTRSHSGRCHGVDPNRNYPYHWLEAGASRFSCDETYAGPKPLSEPETTTLAKVLDNNKDRIVMYLSLHAYSQLFLSPYGYGKMYPDNYEELKRVANAGMKAIYTVRGTQYRFGTSSIILYPAAGGSDDYAHGAANIKLSYTIELPDDGRHGFLMPPEEIVPIGEETTIGIAAMIDAM